MLAMGRGLMAKPKLMMLDEPSMGLAPVVVETIFEIIEKLNEAVDRGLWAEPDPELLADLQQVYLDTEGDLEDGQP